MDEQAFVALFREHLPSLSRYLARRTSPNDIEDLASEIFAVAWRKRFSCPQGLELAWLYKIASFVLANHHRKTRKFAFVLPILDRDFAAPSAEDVVLQNSDVGLAFAKLSPADRQVLSLAVFEDLSVKEVAIALSITPNSASQRLTRARQRLSEHLKTQMSDN
jgi:RNA polymerase sigma-70 factor (ECF subfamily)